jgi:hypothetical protein
MLPWPPLPSNLVQLGANQALRDHLITTLRAATKLVPALHIVIVCRPHEALRHALGAQGSGMLMMVLVGSLSRHHLA